MLRQLKVRFILLAIISMTVTLIVAFTAVNINLRVRLANRTDEIIDVLHENGGFPLFNIQSLISDTDTDNNVGIFEFDKSYKRNFHDETPYQTRYYIAYLDESETIFNADYSHIAIANIDMIINQVCEIKEEPRDRGYIDTFRYGRFETDNGMMIIGVDCKTDLSTVNTLLTITLVTIIFCVVIVLFLLIILSRKIIKPFEENREKQRRFITDAGHELKTPIAIIQSNTEVMEMIDGENKWLTNIKQQTVRMNNLVKGLIELSKMDEQIISEKEKQKIILSEIVYNSVESFRVPAESKGISLKADIAPNISVMGDLEDIVRLVGILLDNAIKYTDDRKEIAVKLFGKSKKAVLTVENTCKGLERDSVKKFFDRFYRSDSSRNSSTGGYGIGLSMAQAIVQNHKGKLSVHYTDDERIIFTAEL